ncbi:twin-arginine translocase subunit TatC [Legionella oakridgensis]|uniref:twin-arginine translocase subunit TatC n=1 Tax=Legionella oakridgensis TaxID=29423 RepID=UPI0003DDFBCD|nr:twin-arginine translocase subunit TatC [Legionella oakridgensis]ETO92170.1 Sec-independent protein translocase TatC [Legionella oakridgensis RV-2-2007]
MLSHLIELRRRLLHTLFVFLIFFVLFFTYSGELFLFLVQPLIKNLPAQDSLIATYLTSPLFIPIQLAADSAMLLTAPFALFHVWRFVSPGLYRHEQENVSWAIIISLTLFAVGVLFCFYLVLPFMLQFFAQAVPQGVRFLPDMAYAVDFILRMLLIFGVCFQVPLLCLLLVRLQLLQVSSLKLIRPYVIVAAFIIGMLLTPPDVFSQIMLALPLCLLYEFGLLLAVFFQKKQDLRKIPRSRQRN